MTSSAGFAAGPPILPLRTLRLYETGVGYFERTGVVSTSGATALPIPAGHLDDALKTLVIHGKDGKALVHGVEFGSSMSKGMARTLAGLPTTEEPMTYKDLLASLKGAKVQLQSTVGSVTGRIIEVSETTEVFEDLSKEAGKDSQGAAKDKDSAKSHLVRAPEITVLLLSDNSEIRRFRGRQILSVRPLDPGSASRLGSALDALSTRGAQTRRLLRLLTRSDGPVTIGYVAETPVWRTTYRLVFGKGGDSGVLQGWALLHNDADEDWRGVQVHLVNGKPDSFLFPLAAPRYDRRELIRPETELSTVPQLLDTTVDAMYGDQVEGGLGLSGYGAGGGGSGSGSIGLGRIGTVGRGAGGGGGVGQSSVLEVGNLAEIEAATGVEAGALFTYTLAAPLDLRAHGSALVPFLQHVVEVEALTWFESPGSTGRTTARFKNTTKQTLPQGPISFFADGGFSGEAMLDRLKPGERRFIKFGTDMDLDLEEVHGKSHDEIRRLTFVRGNLVEHFLRHSNRRYALENRSGQARRAYLSLDLTRNAKITGADRVDFDKQSGKPMAVMIAAAQKRAERDITTVEGLSRSTSATAVGEKRLKELAEIAAIPQVERTIVLEAASRYRDLERVRKEADETRAAVSKVEEELKRWREDLRALGGDKDRGGNHPFVQRIVQGEEKLSEAKKRLADKEAEIKRQEEAATTSLSRLPRS